MTYSININHTSFIKKRNDNATLSNRVLGTVLKIKHNCYQSVAIVP